MTFAPFMVLMSSEMSFKSDDRLEEYVRPVSSGATSDFGTPAGLYMVEHQHDCTCGWQLI